MHESALPHIVGSTGRTDIGKLLWWQQIRDESQVTDWTNTLLPIGTLVLGSLLTIAGQTLRDRRLAKNEKLARRESFRVANFEMHRDAMLKMQELARDCYDAFFKEKTRREVDGDYQYFDKNPLRNAYEGVNARIAAWKNIELQEPEKLSKRQRTEYIREIMGCAEAMTEESEKTARTFKESYSVIEKRYAFWDQYVDFIYQLRMCMYRSGSNSVVRRGEEFIDTIYTWNTILGSAGTDELANKVRTARYELDRALSNALTFGPYDTYGSKGDASST